jgi:hypothetical protein
MAESDFGGAFVNGEFYSFARAQFDITGSKLFAVENVTYDDAIELEEIHGAGMAALGFGEGKYTANFKCTVKKEDFEKVILPALTGSDGTGNGTPLYEHEPFKFTMTYAKRKATKTVSDTIEGIRIMSVSHSVGQGDKSLNVEISGKALGGIVRNGVKPVSTPSTSGA